MENKDFSIRQCCIVTNMSHIDMEKVKIELDKRKCIEKWAYIIHDKDVYSESDENKNPLKKQGSLKAEHIHLMLKFKSPQNARLVTNWFDLPVNMLSKIKGKWMTALMYLTHKNDPSKYQYDNNEVVCNFDYEDAIDTNQINTATSRSVRETEIKNLINDEIIREYNIHNYVTHLEYSKYERAITSTFKYVHNRLEEQKKDKNMKVIYIQGESSAGKSTYAKKMAEDKNMSYYVSSSSNDVLDSYKGQDCLILDDLRSDSMTFSDLLKMLDNNTSSSVKSRFKNKSLIYCKLVIITTTQPLDDFIEKLPKSTTEDSTQLKRRIGALVYLTKQHMSVYSYDEVQKRHLLTVEGLENPILKLLKEKEINKEKELDSFLDLLGVDSSSVEKKNSNYLGVA